jgi:iron complex transport system substrate-binding protein
MMTRLLRVLARVCLGFVLLSACAAPVVPARTSAPPAATTALPPAATGATAQSPTHVVTGMTGEAVTVPVTVERIAEQFPAHTVTDLMLGAGPRLVAIPVNVKTLPFLRKVFAPIEQIPELFQNGGGFNMEDLLTTHPDVVSSIDNAASLKPFQSVGIPALSMTFQTYPDLQRSITLAGQVYGGSATDRADKYNAYFTEKFSMVQSRSAALTDAQRPTVVHIASYPPLVIDGGASLIDTWIALGGGTDAARDIPGAGNHASISMEQLLSWNPDVLIVETPGGDQALPADSGQSVVDQLARSPLWSSLKAVQSKHVYVNPQGLYPWERFGPEEALQIQWISKRLHPDLFPDVDMRAVTRSFYQTFFDYTPTDADLDTMLANAQY